MCLEIWKDLVGYEESYQISNLGNLKSKDKMVKSSNNSMACKKGQLIKTITRKHGYVEVCLCNKNKKKTFRVHRLVAISFIPNSENKKQVNHINGIKTDNRLENLEWCTSKENINHAFDVLKRKPSKGKINLKPVLDINTGVFYRSCKEVCFLYGYNLERFRRTLSGRHKNKTQFIYA